MESTSPHSFSSSQQQYAGSLLAAVSELRTELERSISKLHALEETNRSLTDGYEAVKDELVETRKKYLEAQDNYQKTAVSKMEGDKANAVFMDKIKQQLQEKTKEFDALREKLVPQDIEYIKIKVQEELEIPHRHKLLAMEAELANQKDLFYAMRRESERYKADYEYFSQAQQREVGAIRTEHEAEVALLREQIARLQSRDVSAERDEKLRAIQIRMQETQRAVDVLRQEKESCVVERDGLAMQVAQLKSSHEQTAAHLKAQLGTAQVERQSLDQRLQTALGDADTKESQLRALRQTCEDAVASLEAKAAAMSDKEAQFSSAKEMYADELERLRAKYEGELGAKDAEAELLLHRLGEREDHLRRLQKEASDMQVRAETNEGELRRSHLARVQELKQRVDALEVDCSASKRDQQLGLIHKAELGDKFAKEGGMLRAELSRLKREKEVLLSRSTVVEQALDSERRKLSAAKRTAAAKAALSNDLTLEMRTKVAELEKRLQDSREREIKATADQRATEDLLSHKEKEFAANLDSMQREAHSRYEQLGREYKEQLDQVKASAQRAVAKERKRSEGYKEKALEAHQRGKLLSAVISAGAPSED